MSAPGTVRALLRRRPAPGSPLADRNFRLLTAGQATSTIGDFCYAVALPWFVLSSHGGTVLLGTVLACYGVPRTALIPLGGILADRIGPRRLMLGADVARCLLAVALTVLAARHLATLAWLAPVAALLGAGEGLFMPASFAIMPSLLPAESLQAGNAINSAAVQVGTVLGPALGGTLVATSGPGARVRHRRGLVRRVGRRAVADAPAASRLRPGGGGRGGPGGRRARRRRARRPARRRPRPACGGCCADRCSSGACC